MTHGSLFSGIGGFELGAQMNNIPTLWNCEIEDFQRSILKQEFPDTKQYEDIRELQSPEHVDIISGGFPCQDISIAGKGVGISGERSGLWSEMFRIIREVRPRYVLIENSPMLLVRGFEKVLCDLSKIGYDAEWKCISNSFFGYPHKRLRLYVCAYSNQIRRNEIKVLPSIFNEESKWFQVQRREFSRMSGESFWSKDYAEFLRMDNGISYNVHRLEAIGNAVNPIIAGYLFDCIKKFDNQLK
ncbi:DNA cytosine methyltransferase [Phocaeicola faecalis]